MGMVVRTNTMALNAFRQLGMNNSAVSKSLEKLSSGYRINRAGDDAAGLAISEKMKAQIKGLETASSNAQDGISLIQTAEGALTEVHSMLNRMVELATKSANGTYSEIERSSLQDEVDALLEEIDRIGESTNFNGINLLDGSMGLNKTAFTVGDLGGVDAAAGTVISLEGKVPTKGTDDATLHLGTEGNDQGAPSFTIDLGDLALAAGTGDNASVEITVGSTTLKSGDLGATAKTTKDIRDAIVGNFVGWTDAGTATNTVKIGDAVFTVAAGATDSEITFTYAGLEANGAGAAATDEFTADQAEAINAALGQAITATVNDSTGGSHTGDVMHATMDVEQAVAKTTGQRAGIDLTMTDLVKDGYTLTIDGTTYTFKTDKDSNVTGDNLIDVSAYDEADQVEAAIELLSKQSTANFNLEAKNGTTLHIDQKVGSTQVYDTYEKLTGAITAKTASTTAGTTLTVADNTAIVAGDSLQIGGKSYVFGAEDGQVAIGDTAADTLDNLLAALKADGVNAVVDGDTITVYGAEGEEAPAVIGGGLTLQIGDTGAEYNIMNVAVNDMRSQALGLAGLKITDATSARDAIDTIKDAINNVSSTRAGMGALQNRLEYTINNLDVAVENMSAANSRIRDTDMAKEMMNYTKMNVLVQSAQAMLAQANQQPQSILQLLQ